MEIIYGFMKNIELLKDASEEFFKFAYALFKNCDEKLLNVSAIEEIVLLYSKVVCEYTDEPLVLLHGVMDLLRVMVKRCRLRIDETLVNVLVSIGFPFISDISCEQAVTCEKSEEAKSLIMDNEFSFKLANGKTEGTKSKEAEDLTLGRSTKGLGLIASFISNPQVGKIKKLNGSVSNLTVQTTLKLLKAISKKERSLIAKIISPFKFLLEM